MKFIMKSFLILFSALFIFANLGLTQEIRKNSIAKDDKNVQLDEKKFDVNQMQSHKNSKEMWDVMYWFSPAENITAAMSTDGINIYVASDMINGKFFRHNMDGSNPVSFTISGIPANVGSLTYDGTYFYATAMSNLIYKLDLANQTLITAIFVNYPGFSGLQGISYDPTLDNGNGGFWIGDWYNMGAISMSGIPLVTSINFGWDFQSAIVYDPYSDPLNPCLWCLHMGTGAKAIFKQFDINTMSYTGVIHDCDPDHPSGGYGSGRGAFAYNNGEGKFLIACNIRAQTGSDVILVYDLCDLALPAAPSPVTDFIITPNSLGELNAELAWTNPVLTEDEGILTQLTAIKIYENNELIYTISNPTIGEQETYTTTVTEVGEYIYSVIAENSIGESLPNMAIKWIGHDLPSSPDNVTVIKNGIIAELSWSEVTTGLHDGYFTTSGLLYDICRYPDEIIVATNHTTTTFSETIENQGYYYYRVTAKNDFGEGGYTDSNIGVFCDVKTLPYFEGFENNGIKFPVCWEQEFVTATNTEWEVIESSIAPEGNFLAEIRIHVIGLEITKLITPPLDLSGDGNYVLSFLYSARGSTGIDYLRVYYRTSASDEWNLLEQYTAQIINLNSRWKKSTIALPNGTDNYFIAFEGQIESTGILLDAISVFDARIVTGIVTDGTDPMEGVKVEVEGASDLFAFTDETGYYEILDIGLGTYNLKATILGYNDKIEQITVSGSITIQDFVLTPLSQYSVSGKITGSDAPDGVAEVTVTLSGYNTYTTTTNSSGNYYFANVYGTKTYNIEARKVGYAKYNSTISVTTGNVTHNFEITENDSPVVNPVAVDYESYAEISWSTPIYGTSEIFRYDSGIANSQLGFYGNDAPKGVIGSCHRENAAIDKIQWFLTDEAPINPTHVNIYIFELNASGMPTKNIIGMALMVPTSVMKWCEYEFPEPVMAPNGFFMALSRPVGAYLSLGTSNPTEEWIFQPNTHFFTFDYETIDFIAITQLNGGYNFMIRAEGYSFGKETHFGYPVDKSITNYKIYRLLEGQQFDEESWTTLSTDVTDLFFTDNEWNSVKTNSYRWAVKAEYSGGIISVPRFSNTLVKINVYTVTFNIIDEQTNEPIEDAIIEFDGVLLDGYTVENVLPGDYEYIITKEGYETKTGQVTINDSGEDLTIYLTPIITPTYIITFIVKDAETNEEINDAVIVFDGDLLTDYIVMDVLPGTYTYMVSHDLYGTETDIIKVESENVTKEILLVKVGINAIGLSNFVLYPNPATSELRVENGELRIENIEVFDVYGRNVVGAYGIRPKTEHPNEIIFDISHLSNGVYFVAIESVTGEKTVFKMVKK